MAGYNEIDYSQLFSIFRLKINDHPSRSLKMTNQDSLLTSHGKFNGGSTKCLNNYLIWHTWFDMKGHIQLA